MSRVKLEDVAQYVEAHIGAFHERRLKSLASLRLTDVLQRKNPYLFKAKNVQTAQDLVKGLLDAYLSSQEEGMFGEFLESLAVFTCSKAFGGRKSTAEGIDLEFDRDGVRYIVAVKSGPNWGNSQQVKKMRDNFRKAARVLRTSRSGINVVAVNGCCYGRDNKPDKGDFLKLCGQRFWEFVSGNSEMYVQIVEPLGHRAKKRNEEFAAEYARIVNLFTAEFAGRFCVDGRIDWQALVRFNSSRAKPR